MGNTETQAILGTRHRNKKNKTKKTTQNTKKMSSTCPTKNIWLKPDTLEMGLIRSPPCYSYFCKSPVGDRRKKPKVHEKENIHLFTDNVRIYTQRKKLSTPMFFLNDK
jgi:hypothetical protein